MSLPIRTWISLASKEPMLGLTSSLQNSSRSLEMRDVGKWGIVGKASAAPVGATPPSSRPLGIAGAFEVEHEDARVGPGVPQGVSTMPLSPRRAQAMET